MAKTSILNLKKQLPGSWQRHSWIAVKWLIFVLSGYYAYRYVFLEGHLSHLFELPVVMEHGPRSIVLVIATSLLVFFNWGFEAYKWQILLKKFQRLSFFASFRAVMAGTSVSLWIPNRAGEYFGRILFLKPEKRIVGILSTLVGSAAQLIVTIVIGVLGLIYYSYDVVEYRLLWIAVTAVGLLCIALLLFIYFNIGQAQHILPHKNWAKGIRKYIRIYSFFNVSDLREVLLASLLRYVVFSVQFFILITLFGMKVEIMDVFATIALIYLVQTVIPTNTVTELGLRGISGSLFLHYTENVSPAVSATYTLWVINLMLPAVAGLIFLLFARIRQKSVQLAQ